MYLAFKNRQVTSKKLNSDQKAKTTVRLMLFEVKLQQGRCR